MLITFWKNYVIIRLYLYDRKPYHAIANVIETSQLNKKKFSKITVVYVDIGHNFS